MHFKTYWRGLSAVAGKIILGAWEMERKIRKHNPVHKKKLSIRTECLTLSKSIKGIGNDEGLLFYACR